MSRWVRGANHIDYINAVREVLRLDPIPGTSREWERLRRNAGHGIPIHQDAYPDKGKARGL